MDGQDWTKVTIKRHYTKEEAKKKFGTPVKKTSPPTSSSGVPLYKIEQSEDLKLNVVTSNMSQQIIQGRLAKKWNQEQLAREAQLPIGVIKSYENPNSSTVINQQYVQKISRAIGVQIKK